VIEFGLILSSAHIHGILNPTDTFGVLTPSSFSFTIIKTGANAMEYSMIDHTADLGVWIRSTTLNQLFKDAAKVLIRLSLGEVPSVEDNMEIKDLEIEGSDLVDLMVRWLGEILYLLDGERLIFWEAQHLQIVGETKLQAVAQFIPFKEGSHSWETYIKAVTYHQAKVEQKDAWWEAFLIFDV